MITVTGAGAIIKNIDGCVFMVKIQRRGMIRWELPTRIKNRVGESIFLTLYRCVEEESSSTIAVRIGRPVCLGLNSSQQLGYQYFAMFFECKAETSIAQLNTRTDTDLPDESRQRILDAAFVDWQQLDPTEVHPQHLKILNRWHQAPNGPFFAVVSDADSEVTFFHQQGMPISLILNPTKESVQQNTNESAKATHPPQVKRDTIILFLASNPEGVKRIAIDQEYREIRQKLRGDSLKLYSEWALRPDDILLYLNEYRPHIVHFSGHGSKKSELIMHNGNNQAKSITLEALSKLFEVLKGDIRLVVLNACYTQLQAEAIVEFVDCVVGMKTAIGDKAAIVFASAFYRALSFGHSVKDSFNQGRVALQLEGIPEEKTPELLVKNGVDASHIFLTESPA